MSVASATIVPLRKLSHHESRTTVYIASSILEQERPQKK